ncbi:hypothetical protein ACTMTU_19485 [Streptomyces sp. OZ13]|uniref:hypothetical protein n=1 Tax=Streptomyces sp. OZ13 TaxID=3452210 RepID=UPI003F8C33C2
MRWRRTSAVNGGGAARRRPVVCLLPLLALTAAALGTGAAAADPPGASAGSPIAHRSAAPPATDGPAPAPDSGVSWSVDLAAGSEAGNDDDANVRHANGALRIRDTTLPSASAGTGRGQGSAVLPVHRLETGANRVAADVRAELPPGAAVEVDIRGRDRNGPWTEWREALAGVPAELPRTVTEVQARLVLQGGTNRSGPAVSSLRLTADRVSVAAPRPASAEPFTARVYATREGLVGGTTANGHVIKPNDHFVALPSRRGLSPKGSAEYSVRVCGPARCETAPVWDVGPWNTRDDHWNPSSVRETFKDLPQGMPEAQAAYEHGYNGGLDGFGRRVLNPAGIDLADGTFYNVGLNDNGWVTVTYLWTGDGTTTKSFPTWGTDVSIRQSATTASTRVTALPGPTTVRIRCQVRGQLVQTDGYSNDAWSYLPDYGGYVSNIYIDVADSWLPGVPTC